jgi:hypothetical protein
VKRWKGKVGKGEKGFMSKLFFPKLKRVESNAQLTSRLYYYLYT